MAQKKTKSQIGRASRNKGKTFERKIANILTDRGIESRRSVQFNGMFDYDLTSEVPINWECKAVESLNIYNAMEQSIADAKKDEYIPTVVHKKNNKAILVTLEFQNFIDILQYALGYVDDKNSIPLKEWREKYIAKKKLEDDADNL
mgnify:CR=1 FL=1